MRYDLHEFIDRRVGEQRQHLSPTFGCSSRIRLAITIEEVMKLLWNASITENQRGFSRSMFMSEQSNVMARIHEPLVVAKAPWMLGYRLILDNDA